MQIERNLHCPGCKKITRHINLRQWGKRHEVCQELHCPRPCVFHADDEEIRKAYNTPAAREARKLAARG